MSIRLPSVPMSHLTFILPLLLADVAHSHVQQPKPIEYSIYEEQPEGAFVGNVKEDSGLVAKYYRSAAILSQLRFGLKQASAHFSVDELTGEVHAVGVLDREKMCPYALVCQQTLEVTVRPQPYYQIIKVIVNVLDVNDHAPAFPYEAFTLDVLESTPSGAVFPVPAAEDQDSEPLSVHKYQLIADTDTFELKVTHQVDGSHDVRLRLRGYLDRETQALYSLVVAATDGGSPPRSASIQLTVRVRDANDNSPQFESGVYEAHMYENLPVGTSVLHVRATDPDEGLNGVVRYRLSSEWSATPANTPSSGGPVGPDTTPRRPFEVNATTGELYVNAPIDYEREAVYRLTVVATDLGPDSLPTFATVTLYVLDLNDNAPRITVNFMTPYRYAQVIENAPIGTFVCHVAVTDADSQLNAHIDCTLDSPSFRLLPLSHPAPSPASSEYKLVTARVFDRELESQHPVTIRCRDGGIPHLMTAKTFTVQISDDNDNSPKMSNNVYFARANENNALHAVIAQMNASDADVGKNAALLWRMEALDGTPADSAVIEATTGLVTANVAFDYEKRQSYSYVVIARDRGDEPRSASATLIVSVVDLNDEAPQFEKASYHFTTTENRPIGSVVGHVRAFDSDATHDFHKVYYFIDDKAGGGKNDEAKDNSRSFRIDTTTGEITNRVVLDRELSSVRRFSVGVSNDPETGTSSQSSSKLWRDASYNVVHVAVYIGDENDNDPQVTFPARDNESVPLHASVPAGYVVTRVLAVDADEGLNALLTYSLVAPSDHAPFSVDTYTGDVTTSSPIDASEPRFYPLTIEVRDGGLPRRAATAHLLIAVNGSADPRTLQLGEDGDRGAGTMVAVGSICGVVVLLKIVAIAVVCRRRLGGGRGHQGGANTDKVQAERIDHVGINESISSNSIDCRGAAETDRRLMKGVFDTQSSDLSPSVCEFQSKERMKKEVTFLIDARNHVMSEIARNCALVKEQNNLNGLQPQVSTCNGSVHHVTLPRDCPLRDPRHAPHATPTDQAGNNTQKLVPQDCPLPMFLGGLPPARGTTGRLKARGAAGELGSSTGAANSSRPYSHVLANQGATNWNGVMSERNSPSPLARASHTISPSGLERERQSAATYETMVNWNIASASKGFYL